MSYKFQFNCLKFSFVGALLLLFQFGRAQKFDDSELNSLLTAKQKQLGGNFVVALTTADTTIYKKDAGDVHSSKTVLPIGDCSQLITAMLVMKFVEEGKLSLDDKVASYIPSFASYNKNYITIRHCLSHYTGIKQEKAGARLVKKFKSLEELADNLASREIDYNAGEAFTYGLAGPNIAGRVLEVVGKRKFDVLVKQYLLSPLGMRRTNFSTTDFTAVRPADGANSTAEDMAILIRVLLNKGTYKGKQVLSSESVETLFNIQTTSGVIKTASKLTEGMPYTLAGWGNTTTDDNASSISLFDFEGNTITLDRCKNYGYISLLKEAQRLEAAVITKDIKTATDKVFKSTCP
jgi:CubicO group peptidase (beta-lactamase class C family)